MTEAIRIEQSHPDWKRIATAWKLDGYPTRVRMPDGYYLAIQDNGTLVFVKENADAARDGSSLDHINGG